jgi:hypothetical protein
MGAPFDGIEWLNPDTSWRVKLRQPGWQVGWKRPDDAGRVSVSIAGNDSRGLLGETDLGVDRWESFAHTRRVGLLMPEPMRTPICS